jgi:TonB family protein
MANDNYITHFTASDIEKYHRGQLSAKQMHDLEKAALDDPFLADALEGYAVAGVNVGADIADLKNRLAQKTEGAKIIPLQTAPRQSFRALRAAVMILFVAGAGLLIYKIGFDKKNNEVALLDDKKEVINSTDTVIKNSKDTDGFVSNNPVGAVKPGEKPVTENDETTPAVTAIENKPAGAGNINKGYKDPVGETVVPGTTTVTPVKTTDIVSAPVKTGDDLSSLRKEDKEAAKKAKDLAKEEADKGKYREDVAAGVMNDKVNAQQNNRNVTASRKAENNNYYSNVNTFRGRVVDADNNGVPFANVTNVQDNNAGTYTDARGYFNLTYPDSVMNIQVRSIGFENNNMQLRNSVPTNQVVLQDDRKSLTEVVLSNQNSNATTRSRVANENMKLEEPEPVDGWVYYDAYLANNLNVPEDLKAKQTTSGSVEVSFEVDKNGEPTNFKIEKSLCTKCDKEAIRLIKAGPKWKRNANKKGRTTVTINF